jgi:hypothetical protein
MTESNPFFEMLCLKKPKMVDNVQNNNPVFSNTPLSEVFRLGLIVSMFINGFCKVGKVIKLIHTVWSMVTVMLKNVCIFV